MADGRFSAPPPIADGEVIDWVTVTPRCAPKRTAIADERAPAARALGHASCTRCTDAGDTPRT